MRNNRTYPPAPAGGKAFNNTPQRSEIVYFRNYFAHITGKKPDDINIQPGELRGSVGLNNVGKTYQFQMTQKDPEALGQPAWLTGIPRISDYLLDMNDIFVIRSIGFFLRQSLNATVRSGAPVSIIGPTPANYGVTPNGAYGQYEALAAYDDSCGELLTYPDPTLYDQTVADNLTGYQQIAQPIILQHFYSFFSASNLSYQVGSDVFYDALPLRKMLTSPVTQKFTPTAATTIGPAVIATAMPITYNPTTNERGPQWNFWELGAHILYVSGAGSNKVQVQNPSGITLGVQMLQTSVSWFINGNLTGNVPSSGFYSNDLVMVYGGYKLKGIAYEKVGKLSEYFLNGF
jgi:hypothetical protein